MWCDVMVMLAHFLFHVHMRASMWYAYLHTTPSMWYVYVEMRRECYHLSRESRWDHRPMPMSICRWARVLSLCRSDVYMCVQMSLCVCADEREPYHFVHIRATIHVFVQMRATISSSMCMCRWASLCSCVCVCVCVCGDVYVYVQMRATMSSSTTPPAL